MARASAAAQLDESFTTLVESGANALIIENDPFFDSRRDRIVALELIE
ncbi:MAG: hypothetical protein ACM3O6_10000 [Acidobacteriota bacterium]